jgi:putative transposase
MSVRLLLTDSIWKRIEKVLNEIKSKVGRPPDISDRMFIEAVLYIARTGIPWRDLPNSLGNFSTIYNRLRRWKLTGIWQKLWQRLETDEIPLAARKALTLSVNSTALRICSLTAPASERTNMLPALLKKQEDSASRPSVEV